VGDAVEVELVNGQSLTDWHLVDRASPSAKPGEALARGFAVLLPTPRRIAVFRPGKIEISGLVLVDGEGREIGNLATQVLTVEGVVAATQASEGAEPPKPEPPLMAEGLAWPREYRIALVIGVVVGGVWLSLRTRYWLSEWRRRRDAANAAGAFGVRLKRTPIEAFLEELEARTPKGSVAADDAKRLYFSATEALKRYLDATIPGLRAVDLTTEELVHALQEARHFAVKPADLDRIEILLRKLDLVKFAGAEPGDEQRVLGHLAELTGWVRELDGRIAQARQGSA